MYIQGDPVALADLSEGFMEVECGYDPCRYSMEVRTTEEYSHNTVEWFAKWTCPSCHEENEKEGWYDPNDN